MCQFNALLLFHKLHLGLLQPAPFSLQLADDSKMQPIGKLGDVPIKIGDIWVLGDFIIVDITETDDAQNYSRYALFGYCWLPY